MGVVGSMFTLNLILSFKREEVVGRDSLRMTGGGRTMAILRVDLGLPARGGLTPEGDMQDQRQVLAVIDVVDYTLIAYSDSVGPVCTSYLPDSPGPRLLGQAPDSIPQPLESLEPHSTFDPLEVAVGSG